MCKVVRGGILPCILGTPSWGMLHACPTPLCGMPNVCQTPFVGHAARMPSKGPFGRQPREQSMRRTRAVGVLVPQRGESESVTVLPGVLWAAEGA